MTVLYQTLASSAMRTSPMSWTPGARKTLRPMVGTTPLAAWSCGPGEAAFHVLEQGFLLELAQVGLVEGLGGAQQHVEEGAEGAEDEDQEGGEEADVDVLGAAADVLPGPDEGGGPDGGAKGGQQRKDDGDGLADGLHACGLRG